MPVAGSFGLYGTFMPTADATPPLRHPRIHLCPQRRATAELIVCFAIVIVIEVPVREDGFNRQHSESDARSWELPPRRW